MEELKAKILKVVNENKKGAFDLKKLAALFDMRSTSQFVMLNKALNQLEDTYELVRDDKNFFMTLKQANLFRGIISVNRKGYGFLDVTEDFSLYIAKTDLNSAMNGDEVLVRHTGTDEGKVVKIISRNQSMFIGTFYGRDHHVEADDERLKGKRVIVTNIDKFKLVHGLKAQFKILNYKNPIKVEIVQIIGHKNDPGVDISSILLDNGIKLEFDPQTLEQANSIEQEVSKEEKENRKDYSNEITVTIDGDDSKDFDDAISLHRTEQGFNLKVHIADVSHYVTFGSALDIEARERGCSVYVTDRVVPMLPHVLSNGICSLNPNVDRLTLTCDMNIDHEGNVIDYEIVPSWINSNARMTYNNVNKILQHDPKVMKEYEFLGDLFFDMQECASLIRKRREAKGCIDFDKDEAKIVVDKNGKAIDVVLRDRGVAERIIEDFMICANECVASYMKWLQYPCVYRIHENPKPKKMMQFIKAARVMGEKFKGDIENIRPLEIQQCLNRCKPLEGYSVLSTLMLRSMQRARYDAHCIGHFGLASEEYLHFTSPIRRYPDLIVHRMLRKYAFEKCTDENELRNDEVLMDSIASDSSTCEDHAVFAERDVNDMKKAEYMMQHIGSIFEGVISSVTNFGFFVELPNTIEGLVHMRNLQDDFYNYNEDMMAIIGERSGKVYRLGDKIMIKVIDASKEDGTIDFKVAKPRKNKRQVWM